MSTVAARRLPVAVSGGVALLTLISFVLAWLAWIPAEGLLVYWLILAAAMALVFYGVKGDLLGAVLLWFVTLVVLHEEFWRVSVPGFFALTIPRIGIVLLAILLVLMLAQRRVGLRSAWPISGVMVGLAAYLFISAAVTGFETRSVVTVHYRLIGGYLFPFIIFLLILHAIHRQGDLRRLAVFFAILSAYLTFTGWCEHLGLRALVVPRFINDPNVGIHWGRVRGPFVMSAAMGLALTFGYFNNLVLARNMGRGRWLLYVLNALMLPTIFWTETRSVWLGFVLGNLIWVAYSRRRTTRVVGVCLLTALVVLATVVNMDNFLGTDRARGGLTDMEPILLRVGLAKMTWEMLAEHPLFGVGFGHFRDWAPQYARDPGSGAYAFSSSALEHNNLLSILAETGLVGLILYVALVVLLIWCSIRLYRKLPARGAGFIGRDSLVLYWVLAAAYLVDGMFRETSDNPFANCLFFGLSAVPVALGVLLGPTPIRARPGFSPGSGGNGGGGGGGRPAGEPGMKATGAVGLRQVGAAQPASPVTPRLAPPRPTRIAWPGTPNAPGPHQGRTARIIGPRATTHDTGVG